MPCLQRSYAASGSRVTWCPSASNWAQAKRRPAFALEEDLNRNRQRAASPDEAFGVVPVDFVLRKQLRGSLVESDCAEPPQPPGAQGRQFDALPARFRRDRGRG